MAAILNFGNPEKNVLHISIFTSAIRLCFSFICLYVSKITYKAMNGFTLNFNIHYILGMIRTTNRIVRRRFV